MNRELAALVMAAAAVVLLALMAWGWRRRTRHDAAPLTAATELPASARVLARFDGFYVATTRGGDALDRVAAPGFGLPSNAGITVSDAGIALDVPGQHRVVIPADRITRVDQATLAIDRIVERDGLTRVSWHTDADTDVDTYLRVRDTSARVVADAIRPIIPARRTGTAA